MRERREKIARGEPVDDLAMEELPEDEESISQDAAVDPKKLLEDLQKRFVIITLSDKKMSDKSDERFWK